MYRQFLNKQEPEKQSINTCNSANSSKQDVKHDEKTEKIVEECWRIVENQCQKYKVPELKLSLENRKTWKIVRVFVSSTFTDFHSEREILVKKVFPELREWCEARRLQLVECDLRWGVPKDSTSQDVIIACMEELDRCHSENEGKPFFINMLGEKYGWIPTTEDVSEVIQSKYDWVPSTSITFMEILYGAYRSNNPNAAFFLRDPEFLQNVPENLLRRFKDPSPLGQCHLQELKEKLKTRFQKRVFEYTCTLGSCKEVNGRKQIDLTDLEIFAENVLEFLKEAIDRSYPYEKDAQFQSDDELENEQHRDFMLRKAEMVYGRGDLLEKLMMYTNGIDLVQHQIQGEGKAFVRDPEFWESEEEENKPLVVTGAVGYGKTSVLAKHVQSVEKAGVKVFYHFVGASPSSYHSDNICKRLAQVICGTDVELPEDERNPISFYMKKMKEGLKEGKHTGQLLLVLDGMNELNDRQTYNHMSWLPPSFPPNIRCIVSSADDHLPTTHRLKEHPCYVVDMPPLDASAAREIITANLNRFGKKLDKDQLESIVNQPCSKNPLWLWLLGEKLRTFGDFRSLDQRIHAVSESVDSLIGIILKDLIEEDDTGHMTKFLSLIGISQNGVPTKDLVNLLGDVENKVPLPHLYWSKIRRMTLPYLRSVGVQEVITFKHSAILINVKNTLLSEAGMNRKWHKLMVDYFLGWCENRALRLEAIPYHCKAAGLKKEMVEYMRKNELSSRYPTFIRSLHMELCRCRNMADPVMPAVHSVVLCFRCSMLSGGFFPAKYYMNKDACVICGCHVFTHQAVKAHTCMQHSVGGLRNTPKCLLCGMIVWLDEKGHLRQKMDVYGNLCQHCGFFLKGKQCSFVYDN